MSTSSKCGVLQGTTVIQGNAAPHITHGPRAVLPHPLSAPVIYYAAFPFTKGGKKEGGKGA